MTNAEIEAGIRKNYPVRNKWLLAALQDGATRTRDAPRVQGEPCAICRRREHGGGLFPFRQRDGQELLLGERCALFLDYLMSHQGEAGELLR